MTLPSSFPLSVSQINVELGRAANAPFDMNGAQERALAGVPSGPYSFSDFLGKSSFQSSYIGGYASGGNTTTVSIGAPDSTRKIIVFVCWIRGSIGSAGPLSSITIGGYTATIRVSSISGNVGCAIADCAYPAPDTGAVVSINTTGFASTVNNFIAVVRVTGSSFTPGQFSSASSGSLAVPSGNGLMLLGGANNNGAPGNFTFSGATEQNDSHSNNLAFGAAFSGGLPSGSRAFGITGGLAYAAATYG